jgi:ribosomal protein L28
MNTNEKLVLFRSIIIMILFLSMFYLAPIIAQNSTSITESHLIGNCQAFTKLQNEKLNLEKKLNETKQNFLPNLIQEKSLTLKLDDLNSKLALFANDNEFTKLQNEKLNLEKKLNETKQNFLPNLIQEKSLTLKLDDLNSKLALLTDNRYCSELEKRITDQN